MKRWNKARIDAVLNAVTAMLAGEEGEGDWGPGTSAKDLEAGLEILQAERARLAVLPACPRCGSTKHKLCCSRCGRVISAGRRKHGRERCSRECDERHERELNPVEPW